MVGDARAYQHWPWPWAELDNDQDAARFVGDVKTLVTGEVHDATRGLEFFIGVAQLFVEDAIACLDVRRKGLTRFGRQVTVSCCSCSHS